MRRLALLEDVLDHLTDFSRRVRAEVNTSSELSYVEYTLLRAVGSRDRATVGDVAAAVHIDKSTASRQLAALERAGLLRRDPDPQHTRGHLLTLTDRAVALLDRARAAQVLAVRERVRDWTDEDLETFAALLHRYNNPNTPPPA